MVSFTKRTLDLCKSIQMGPRLTRDSVNDILKGRAKQYFYKDEVSRELYQTYRALSRSDNANLHWERTYDIPVLQIAFIGYYHGEIVAFRFKGSHHPFILFEYRNEDYDRILQLLKSSQKLGKRSENGYSAIAEDLYISYLYEKGTDFYWVTDVQKLSLPELFSELAINK